MLVTDKLFHLLLMIRKNIFMIPERVTPRWRVVIIFPTSTLLGRDRVWTRSSLRSFFYYTRVEFLKASHIILIVSSWMNHFYLLFYLFIMAPWTIHYLFHIYRCYCLHYFIEDWGKLDTNGRNSCLLWE